MKKNKRKVFSYIAVIFCIVVSLMTNTGCRLYSPGQNAIAKDLREKYRTVTPSSLQALESLDKTLDRLIESERNDFKVYKDTLEQNIINGRWSSFITNTSSLKDTLTNRKNTAETKIKKENEKIAELKTRLNKLNETLEKLNEALTEAEKKKTTEEKLNEAKMIINSSLTILEKLTTDASLTDRLKEAAKEIKKYLEAVKAESDKGKSDKVYSLVVEAIRLGRDISSLEKEALQQDINYHIRAKEFYEAEINLLPEKFDIRIDKIVERANKYKDDKAFPDGLIIERINYLAKQSADAEQATSSQSGSQSSQSNQPSQTGPAKRSPSYDDLTNILEDLATYETFAINNNVRAQELELRAQTEKYRNSRLLDVIYERQRITLISYGLEGVVRYAEGGLRPEDVANLINATRSIAEAVIAARVGD